MTPASRHATPIPPAPASSTGPSFDARATKLLARLRTESADCRAVGLDAQADELERQARQVEGMRSALRIQERGLDVRPVGADAPKAPRSCVVCREGGHNLATHGRAREIG